MANSSRLQRGSVARDRRFTVALIVIAVLSLGDVATYFVTDGLHPPRDVAIALTVLGLVSLALTVWAWLGAGRGVLWALVVLRALSALSSVPAFFVSDVPVPAMAVAVVSMVLNVAGIVLIWSALTARS